MFTQSIHCWPTNYIVFSPSLPPSHLPKVARLQEQIQIEKKIKQGKGERRRDRPHAFWGGLICLGTELTPSPTPLSPLLWTGAEMMIQVYESSSKGTTISKEEVTTQLAAANKKINALTRQIEAFSASDGGKYLFTIVGNFYNNNTQPLILFSVLVLILDISSSSSNLKRGSGNEPLSPRSTRDMRHVSLPKAHHTSTNGDGEAGGGGIGASAGSFGNINGSNPSSPKLGRRNMNGATTGSTTNPSTTKTATMPLGVTTALISKQTIASISDILLKIRNPTEAPHVRLDCMNNLLKIMRTNSDEELGFPLINVIKGIRYCLVDSQKEMRANGFRFLRHIIGGPTDRVIDVIYDLHVDLFLIRYAKSSAEAYI